MNWAELIGIVSTAVVAIGGISAMFIPWSRLSFDRKTIYADKAQERRRDTIADRDALIDQMRDELDSAKEDIALLSLKVSSLYAELRNEWKHNRELEHHIWLGRPAPPPERPRSSNVTE